MFRGRYRKSFETPAPIPADAGAASTRFSLHTQNYTFKAGHRVMVQVQSTWFPLIDRNPQTFTKSIFDAEEKDFVRATHRVYRSARYPSRVEVPVVTGDGERGDERRSAPCSLRRWLAAGHRRRGCAGPPDRHLRRHARTARRKWPSTPTARRAAGLRLAVGTLDEVQRVSRA